MERKLFSVKEANLAIPRLSGLLETLQHRLAWMKANPPALRFLVAKYQLLDEGPVRPDYYQALVGVRKLLREVEGMGVQIKDVSTGLVDFPARLHGRDVLLCWRLGETKVRFWHDLQTGFAGRQPLPDDGAEPGDDEGS